MLDRLNIVFCATEFGMKLDELPDLTWMTFRTVWGAFRCQLIADFVNRISYLAVLYNFLKKKKKHNLPTETPFMMEVEVTRDLFSYHIM